jgi:hypothetical protein
LRSRGLGDHDGEMINDADGGADAQGSDAADGKVGDATDPRAVDRRLAVENETRANDVVLASQIALFACLMTAMSFGCLILTTGWRSEYYLSVTAAYSALALSTGVVLRRHVLGMARGAQGPTAGFLGRTMLFSILLAFPVQIFLLVTYRDAVVAWHQVLFAFFFAAAAGLTIVSVEGGFDFAIGGALGLLLPMAVERSGPPAVLGVSLQILIPVALAALGLVVLKKAPDGMLGAYTIGLVGGWLETFDALRDERTFPFVAVLVALAAFTALRIFFGVLPVPQPRKVLYLIAFTMIAVGVANLLHAR